VGLDISPKVCELQLGDGIDLHCFDQADQTRLRQLASTEFFDIVIDDGSHAQSDVISSFSVLFELLAPGGLYVVEDTHTSYLPDYKGGLRRPNTSVEFFKFWTDCLTLITVHENVLAMGDPNAELTELLCHWIDSIKFVDSMVVIRKRKSRKTPLELISTGDLHHTRDEWGFRRETRRRTLTL